MLAPRLPGSIIESPVSLRCPRCGTKYSSGDAHRCRFAGPNPPGPDPRWQPTRAVSPAQQRAQLAAAVERCRAALELLVAHVDGLAQRDPSAPAWVERPRERIPPIVARRVEELAFGLHNLLVEK